jgi:ferrochelatase
MMSFGTAATVDDVPAYLASVRGGRPAPDDLIAEFQRRLTLVGGSPLTRITREQARALQAELNRTSSDATYHVAVGMRHAPPFIDDGFAELAAWGAGRVVGLAMSPQYSPIIMGGYGKALETARSRNRPEAPAAATPEVAMIGTWHDEPRFIEAMAMRVQEGLAEAERLGAGRDSIPVLFTAHSLPRRVAEQEPDYIEQLTDTAEALAATLDLHPEQWQFAYQSAGHTPEPWLTPDIKDLFPALRHAGHRSALVAPVQFLADHLEVLYDIDVAARDEAAAHGIQLLRAPSLNTLPLFIEALAAVVRRN